MLTIDGQNCVGIKGLKYIDHMDVRYGVYVKMKTLAGVKMKTLAHQASTKYGCLVRFIKPVKRLMTAKKF